VRIAVYSGSFNPLHIGHLSIVKNLCHDFDKVLLIVSPQNPLKKTANPSNSRKRLEDAARAVKRHGEEFCGKVEVSDIEFHLPLPNYTYTTLVKLRESYPDDRICLVVGGDQISDFRRWRNYDKILLEFGICVFPRKGFDIWSACAGLLLENSAYRVSICKMPLVNISSSEIRNAQNEGKDMSSFLM